MVIGVTAATGQLARYVLVRLIGRPTAVPRSAVAEALRGFAAPT
jgi:hypothetical protein